MKMITGLTLLVLGVAFLSVPMAGAQDNPSSGTGVDVRAAEAVVELDPPDGVEPEIWINRIVRHAESPETLERALRALHAVSENRPVFDLEKTIRDHRGRQAITYDHTVQWISITAPTLPPELRSLVAGAVARVVRADALETVERDTERTRAEFGEIMATCRALAHLAETDRRRAIDESGMSEVSIPLEHDRLIALREELGAILNEVEIEALEGDGDSVPAARLVRVKAKIADVDKRLQGLQDLSEALDGLRATRDEAWGRMADARLDLADLDLVSSIRQCAKLIRSASNKR
jgi:hypothetical protein